MVKKIPDWIRNWKKKVTSPPVICMLLNMERRTIGLRPASSRCASHNSRAPMTSSPPMTSQTTGETPRREGPFGLGRTHPQTPERRTPYTVIESPTMESRAPSVSKEGLASDGVSLTPRTESRMISTITTSPANTQRHEAKVVTAPPTSGPAATAMAPAAAISP